MLLSKSRAVRVRASSVCDEAEGMAAVAAAVLGITAAALNKADVVAREHAHKRVPNLRATLLFAEK